MRKKFLKIFFALLFVQSLFNTYARDYSKDTYVYDSKGFRFFNTEAKMGKYYLKKSKGIKGIDVSKWQKNIDWKKVKESGVEFAMIRDGYGKKFPHQIDEYFHKNIKDAKKNGIKCGVYHYSYATSPDAAIAEAEFCYSNIKGYKLEYPIAFDIEDRKLQHLGKEKLTQICNAFCSFFRKRGYYVTIYTNLKWINNFLFSKTLFKKYDLWFARYYKGCEPSYNCGMWQYTSAGKIKGIGASVDFDVSYIDYAQVTRELSLNGF